ncbi:hypothetical protein LC653_06465 [Nostoc sp. CHAB 5784]|nr:hypothetical protein [Nostoc mirabile]MCC5663578.1 hypothetical protein [Nostoc mirabile CHAB5784]
MKTIEPPSGASASANAKPTHQKPPRGGHFSGRVCRLEESVPRQEKK